MHILQKNGHKVGYVFEATIPGGYIKIENFWTEKFRQKNFGQKTFGRFFGNFRQKTFGQIQH